MVYYFFSCFFLVLFIVCDASQDIISHNRKGAKDVWHLYKWGKRITYALMFIFLTLCCVLWEETFLTKVVLVLVYGGLALFLKWVLWDRLYYSLSWREKQLEWEKTVQISTGNAFLDKLLGLHH